jgi:hypothetical protein
MPVVRVPADGPALILVIPVDSTATVPMPTVRAVCRNPLARWEVRPGERPDTVPGVRVVPLPVPPDDSAGRDER